MNRESGEFPAGGIGQDVVLIHAASRKKGKKAVRKIEACIGAVFRHLCDGMNQGGVDENQISSLSGQKRLSACIVNVPLSTRVNCSSSCQWKSRSQRPGGCME